ncbi:MAG: IS200/IS605 family transposase [Chitinophagaceae bacterium]
MPYIKVWLHLVWSTKNRLPFLTNKIRQTVFEHIRQNAKQKDIFLDCVNGYTDHIHCLVSLSNDQTISKLLQLIKGESSFSINKQNLCASVFQWQEEYFAVSVSHSQVQKVREYIYDQENHHQKKTFQQEYEMFIKNYGFDEVAVK